MHSIRPIAPRPGDVWYCNLDKYISDNSSIQKGKRPWLILNVVQSCDLDDFSIPFKVFVSLPLTSVIKREDLPVHYVIEDWQKQGLKERSMVMGEQQFSLRRKDLIMRLTTVDKITLMNARRVALFNNGIKMKEYMELFASSNEAIL